MFIITKAVLTPLKSTQIFKCILRLPFELLHYDRLELVSLSTVNFEMDINICIDQ